MLNLMVMSTFAVFNWKRPFWENLVQKLKIICLSQNVAPNSNLLIQIY